MKRTRIVKVEGGIFRNKMYYKFTDKEGKTIVDLSYLEYGEKKEAETYLTLVCSIEEAVTLLIDALKNTGATYEKIM